MFRRLGIGVALAFIGVGGAALISQQLGAKQPERPPEAVYAETCGYCHGRNVGPIIRGRSLAPEAVKFFVRNGFNAMPAFRPTEISGSELDALADWIEASEADPKEKGK